MIIFGSFSTGFLYGSYLWTQLVACWCTWCSYTSTNMMV